jgi:hypothetical protein
VWILSDTILRESRGLKDGIARHGSTVDTQLSSTLHTTSRKQDKNKTENRKVQRAMASGSCYKHDIDHANTLPQLKEYDLQTKEWTTIEQCLLILSSNVFAASKH